MGEPELNDVEGNVLVEGVENETAHSVVIGGAVNEKKPTEEAELGDRVIRSAGCLETLHTGDTDANVSLLNHGNIIGSVSNGQRHRLRLNCYSLNNFRLLTGRHSTANDGPALQAQLEEILLQVTAHGIFQGLAVND